MFAEGARACGCAGPCAESRLVESCGRRLQLVNDLEAEAGHLQTLEQAFRWARSRQPPVTPLETIPQDEYTHDVIFGAGETLFLVFDAT